jgi:hypothetical protein
VIISISEVPEVQLTVALAITAIEYSNVSVTAVAATAAVILLRIRST